MRRALVLLIVLVSLGLPANASASAGHASVELLDCTPALEPAARSATFEARIRAIRRSVRLQVRFTLQSRSFAGAWARVPAPGFDLWLSSRARVRRFSYAKTVQNLAAPAAYRTVVRFRWLDARKRVLRRARARSAACRQPDLRPDLHPGGVEVQPAARATERRYVVALRNRGRTGAGLFATMLAAGAGAPATALTAGLAPGERHRIVFVAAACEPGDPLTITVDAGDAVDERDEADNVLVATCPQG